MVVWNEENAAHLLARAGFGGSESDIRKFLHYGQALAVESLLKAPRVRRRALLVLALAVGCGGRGNAYPAEVVENFLRACTSKGASEAACQCSLDAIRRRYTVDEYRALESRVARGEMPPELVALTADCRPPSR
jgi:hypothetical protein